jgi:hypothetical protein
MIDTSIMATTSSAISVPVPLETVWETLARFGDVAQWGRGVSQSNVLTEAASGVGAVRRVQVGRIALRETVTVWEPLRALGYRIEGLPAIVRSAGNTWILSADGAGTRVTLTGVVETKVGRLVDKVVAGRIGKANAELLAGLQDHVSRAERA